MYVVVNKINVDLNTYVFSYVLSFKKRNNLTQDYSNFVLFNF